MRTLSNCNRFFIFVLSVCAVLGLAPAVEAQASGSLTWSDTPAQTVASSTEAHDDQIIRLYKTVLGRMPDAEGAAYWTQRRLQGESLVDIARVMLTTPEPIERSSGDFIVDAYRNALDREPDSQGYAYWTALDDPALAIAYISDSEEHRQVTGTIAPPPRTVAAPSSLELDSEIPVGWVNAGHGVYVPPILLAIRWCESTDNYTAANRYSSARGAYQFLRSSWAAYGHAARYGVASADLASPAQQDEAAVITWQRSGTRPWLASAHCWG